MPKVKSTGRVGVAILLLVYSIISFAQNSFKVEISGVNETIKKNIEESLAIKSLSLQSPEEITLFFNLAPEKIKKALEPFGYFKATIHSSLSQRPPQWISSFHISPGPPIPIHTLDLTISGEGRQDAIFKKILATIPLAKHKNFLVPDYNQTKKMLFATALERGYFDAKFDKTQIIIDLNKYQVTVIIHFNTGPRYSFGKLFFNKSSYDPAFLARFSPFKSYEYYSDAKVQEFQQALSGSNYFKEVFVNPEIEQRHHQVVPIKVALKPLPPRQYNLGIGYGTDTGVRGLASLEWRRLTADGQRFKSELQASQVKNTLQLDYTIPGKKPATDKYVLSAAMQQETQILGKSNLQKIAASYVTVVQGWQQITALTLQHEHFTLAQTPYQTQLLLMPSISWMKTSQDDPLRPSKGKRISLSFLGAPNLFGNNPFLQSQFNIKSILPLWEKNRLLLRASLGYTKTPAINKLPLSLQFLAGGSQSIRGYGYNSLGPGPIMWLGSLEYRQHIKKDWYAVVFCDGGNVSNSLRGAFKRSIGVGAVWQSPLGALELTLAQAEDLPGKPFAIQFSMGPDL